MIDFNFYPEKHMGELEGLLDVEVPQGWTLEKLIRQLHDAKIMLWTLLRRESGSA